MGKIKNPIQFSRAFKISDKKLYSLGVLDPTLNVDAKLFIDPLLLKLSRHPELKKADKTYREYFSTIIKLLAASKKENDAPWRAAYKKLLFREIKGTCLGYGAASISGNGFGPRLTSKITATAKEIIDLGITDPDLFWSLPLLEENVGPDLISDMTTNIILRDLLSFNERIIKKLKIPNQTFVINGITVNLPRNPTESTLTPVILVPMDILRDLPIANDWSEVCDAAHKNAGLRERVNELIAEIWLAKTRKQKEEIRQKALETQESFETVLDLIHEVQPTPYNVKEDPEGIFTWRNIRESIAVKFPLNLKKPRVLNLDEVYGIVLKIIQQFQHLIEARGLSRELWHKGKKRGEKSVQRIFFAVADSYCQANNLDVSPEIDTGTGEIDFKFSQGYENRVLVEVKLSDNPKLLPGYTKQLEAYRLAEKSMKGIYIVIDVGRMGKKDEQLIKLKNEQTEHKLPASEIVFIDGQIKESASRL
ncbi:hypothetical protein FBR05_06680 [Deltaproteobacteria bacterium PRO3]|nr:hypothetical protein [Deltaproteobacteria bacterium PRO3]